jgi:hypothetical protein
VRAQKKQEAQEITETVIDAETRVGELPRESPKAGGEDRKSAKIKMFTRHRIGALHPFPCASAVRRTANGGRFARQTVEKPAFPRMARLML